jgi:hypothetical protein
LSTPELNLGSGAPTPSSSRLDPAAAAAARKKSANWLVDAMTEKPKKSAGQDGREKLPGATDDEKEKSLEPSAVDEKEKADEKPKRVEKVANPLDSYVASWVSPQDLSLVRSIMRDQGPEAGSDPLLASIPAGGATGSAREVTAPFGTAAAAAPTMPSAPRENPFLQLLNTPPPSAAASQMAAPPAAATISPMVATVPPVPDPAASQKSPIPSFVKPREDEKFNKQMKRF